MDIVTKRMNKTREIEMPMIVVEEEEEVVLVTVLSLEVCLVMWD
jgi:hypothetical protein